MSKFNPTSLKTLCAVSVSTLLAVTAATSVAADQGAGDSSVLSKLMQDSKTAVNFRYRYEGVDQDGFNEDANANTVRTRLTWTSGTVNKFSGKIEFDDVRSIGDDNYNSTANKNGAYPVVADPEGSELNQAFVQYKDGGFMAIVGRQAIKLDDQRFVGTVGWRQNEQTYDAVRFKYKTKAAQLDYSYVDNVNRIFGPDGDKANLKGETHLLNAKFDLAPGHSLTAFDYYLDFDKAAALSSNTYGLRYVGKFEPVKITASYARQSDTASNPTQYDADYWLLDASGKVGQVSWSLGQETLGSDNGVKAFNTPLATLHKFQGFADKFLGTPANGIEDRYLSLGTKLQGVALKVSYHQLDSENTSADLGTEWNASAAYKFSKNLKALVKYADYQADTHATDTRKLWFQVLYTL